MSGASTPSNGSNDLTSAERVRDLRDRLQARLGPGYVVGETIAGGGMSVVFLATDAVLNRRVVLKVLPRELATMGAIDRFKQEIALAAALQHPQIVPLFGAGELDGLPYFAMPYVEGESLRARLARGPLSIREAVSILIDVSRALAFAHDRGVVHRDIKPDNILLTAASAVVTDFGVAKAIANARRGTAGGPITPFTGITQEGTSLGTPVYMAPEQVVGDPATDHRADLYALGVVAYEMLVGAAPFAGRPQHKVAAAQLAETPAPISSRRNDVPEGLEALVMQCLEKDAAERPRTARDVMRTLQNPDMLSGAPARRARQRTTRTSLGEHLMLLGKELQFAARGLIRTPTVTISAIICLALGLGVTAAIYSAIDRALLQPLPFREPGRLLTIYRTTPHFNTGPFSIPNFLDLARTSRQIEGMSALSQGTALVDVRGSVLPVSVMRASGALLPMLGVTPLLGRVMGPADDDDAQGDVAMLSAEFWRSRFGGDSSLVNKTITLDGKAVTVVGILPPDLHIAHGTRVMRASIWIPFRPTQTELKSRRSNFLLAVGRLAPGATVAGAAKEMTSLFDAIATTYPDLKGEGVRVLPMQAEGTASVRDPLQKLGMAVVMVLLIAVTNVAALLLARGVQRQRELSIRTALGASRWAVMRPVFAESLLLAAIGVAFALVLAWGSVRVIGALAAQQMPQLAGLAIDPGVIGFSVALATVVALLCGVVPAWRNTSVDPQDALRSGRGGGAERRHHNALGALVIVEGALSLVLLVAAGLLLRGFVNVLGDDPGFQADRLLALDVRVSPEAYASGTTVRRFLEPAIAAIDQVPGVEASGAISLAPYRNWGNNFNIRYEGQPGDNPTKMPIVENRVVTPDFFAVTQQRLMRGRPLMRSDDETAQSPHVVVVNQALADRDFKDQDPIGKRFYWGEDFATIVGVVSNIRNVGPGAAPRAEIYSTYRQVASGATGFSLLVRAKGDPAGLTAAVQDAIRKVDPSSATSNVAPMRTVILTSVGRPRFILSLMGVFATVAIALAVAGLYGVLSYSVAQRTRELGIRAALGSTPVQTVQTIMRRGVLLVSGGIALGIVGGIFATRSMKAMLYGVQPLDVQTWVLAILALAIAGLIASLGPAFRASRVDPIVAMRTE